MLDQHVLLLFQFLYVEHEQDMPIKHAVEKNVLSAQLQQLQANSWQHVKGKALLRVSLLSV